MQRADTVAHMTNMPAAAGFTFAPAFVPGEDFDRRAKYVMLDHETENGAIEDGDIDAIWRAIGVVASVCASTTAKIGAYGWPYPREEGHVGKFADNFSPMLRYCHWLAPCCYVYSADEDADRPEYRGDLFARCVGWMGKSIASRPRWGVVSDWTNDSRSPCDDAMFLRQCRAARRAGCREIYVWSGMAYRVWAARMQVGPAHTAWMNVQRARTELLGLWNFAVSSWTPAEIDREYVAKSSAVLSRFLAAWRESGNG